MDALNILIAEDDPVTASMLEFLVQGEGHTVCGIVQKGIQVVPAVRVHRPDLVLMDVHLADRVTGIRATRILLRQVPVPVIIISATENPEELKAIAKSGALGFVKKPIAVDDLKVSLNMAMHHNDVMRKLQTSEVLHRGIFDAAAVGIYICNPEGVYVAANPTYARMLGFSGPAELLGHIFSVDVQVYAKEGRRAGFLLDLMEGKVLDDMESQVYGKDGDMLWISEHLTPNFDESGVMTQYEGVVVDISDKKQAENEREVAYMLMQTTMDAIADYIAVTDLEGNIIYTNRAFERDLAEAVGPDRVLRFCGQAHCPWERFQGELDEEAPKGYQIRGHCSIQGYPHSMGVGITRYLAPEGSIMGAVFVMRAETEDEYE